MLLMEIWGEILEYEEIIEFLLVCGKIVGGGLVGFFLLGFSYLMTILAILHAYIFVCLISYSSLYPQFPP